MDEERSAPKTALRLDALHEFLRLEAAGGIALGLAAAAALIVANSPMQGLYHRLLALEGGVVVGTLVIHKPLLLWLNDGWMAVFFLLVGLEIKRELLEGELRDLRAASLPIVAAVGGMVAPAAVYAAINSADATAMRGWAIPAATDIAFALGVLNLLGRVVPGSLKVLLAAIAIIDDLGAIVIIAAFYTAHVSTGALALAGGAVAALIALNVSGVHRLAPYLVIGVVLWVCVLKSGVHATLAGVVTGFAVPLSPAKSAVESPLRSLEHALHPWVAFLILPAFAFANAGVSLEGMDAAALFRPVTLGIALGLFLGKQLGIFGAVWLAIRAGLCRKPEATSSAQIYGLALLCGVGFTMSLFIGGLAFDDVARAVEVRLGVLGGSLLAAAAGAAVLKASAQAR